MPSTAKIPVFYSFHFANDVFRVQQVRNMGVIEDNSPVSVNEWEEIKRKGDLNIKKWIDENMAYRRCVVVLVGSETASRKWVRYEIKKAYDSGKGLFGVYIHNLKDPRNGASIRGANPFDNFTINNGQQKLSSVIQCYDPGYDAYRGIASSMSGWVAAAIAQAKYR
ncbi:TIR domain-containing protein [Steroidobacter cummioxidans]|uniref:TIR domain-containing protein n=1 Tax=Steroidobacter cummioxidans TaxID=1803913 RepID=UPI000E322679|nr:TIR domain-containing protein [Steroidobacter cummioxidans]